MVSLVQTYLNLLVRNLGLFLSSIFTKMRAAVTKKNTASANERAPKLKNISSQEKIKAPKCCHKLGHGGRRLTRLTAASEEEQTNQLASFGVWTVSPLTSPTSSSFLEIKAELN